MVGRGNLRLALGLEYEGTGWHGWQSQASGNTIQDCLEGALNKFSKESTRVVCAGRTDAGVHARGQVIHFDSEVQRNTHSWLTGVNSFLPSSVAIKWVKEVDITFHARFSAISRLYSYSILNQKIRSPLLRQTATWIPVNLDCSKISEASKLLIGSHDFSAFRSSECQAKSAVRNILKLQVLVQPPVIRIEIEANAFLQHMVRNIVGCFYEIGRGKKPVSWLSEVIASRERRQCARTFPPEGLCLESVNYGKIFYAD